MSINLAPDAMDRLCDELGTSRNELARQVGVTPQTAYRIQRGRTQPGSFFIASLLQLAAKIYGGSPEDHFGRLFVVSA